MSTSPVSSSIDLYWLPLGAGGHSVRLNGRVFEWFAARLEHRERCDLYHSALEVYAPEGRFVIEQAPAWGERGERGVVANGAVGLRVAGRLRLFRYEIRRWRDGAIPDVAEAVDSPQTLSNDVDRARQLLELVPQVPTPVWGRDELCAGEMWNSNSLISWLLVRSGLDIDSVHLPRKGRAPGWDAGIVVANRGRSTAELAGDGERVRKGRPQLETGVHERRRDVALWYNDRVSAAPDTAAKLQGYAHPERLVTTAWLAEHLDDPSVVVVESDEDVLLYETGHIPGAVKIDWHTDLNDPVARDYVDADGFARLMSEKGISRDTTLVFYGDNFNWWAAYALWVASLFGHPDARLLDGGRQKWVEEERELTKDVPKPAPAEYPRVDRDDSRIRAFRDHVVEHARAGGRLVDVRSPGEYSGELLHMPDYPQEGALRGGHIPGAANVPWKTAANDDGTFKSSDELREIYLENLGLDAGEEVVAYCRIGERSSHTWFVLTHLLGLEHVRNYDGSWVEWGNAVGVPIERPGHPVRPPL